MKFSKNWSPLIEVVLLEKVVIAFVVVVVEVRVDVGVVGFNVLAEDVAKIRLITRPSKLDHFKTKSC